MGLNTLGIYHPRYAYHVRPSVNSAMTVTVEIYKPRAYAENPQWQPGNTFEGPSAYELVWRSRGRVAPNKDWRARPKEQQQEFDAVHAMRIQVPMGGNTLEGQPRDMPFYKDYKVRVVEVHVNGLEQLLGFSYIVRNAHMSSNAWLHNLLCDTGTREQENWET